MGELVLACLVPHPPIMVPEVGGAETAKVQSTVTALQKLNRELKEAQTDTLVVITPHGPVFADAVGITTEEELEGDLAQFRAPQVKFRHRNHPDLNKAIRRQALSRGVAVASVDRDLAREYGITTRLDHGIMAPLYYLGQGLDCRLVPVQMGFLAPLELYAFGMAIAQAIAETGGRTALVVSGDMSHCLTPEAPNGYNPRGREFDLKIRELLAALDVPAILELPEDLTEEAAQCGFRPLLIGLGVLDGLAVESEILSYEGPFGVGYLAAAFRPRGEDPGRKLWVELKKRRAARMAAIRKGESEIVRFARETLESYVKGEPLPEPPPEIPAGLPQRAGAFVSLKKHGQLRGCIGTTGPTRENLWQEIRENAISAGTRDPRFAPVKAGELDDLTYSVDVLNPPEPVKSMEDLDPKRYGVIVSRGGKKGLLLPDLEGVSTAAEQVRIAKEKAGIPVAQDCKLERFTVKRFT